MSIATEVKRIQDAKGTIQAAIIEKGVNVPDSVKLDGYPEYIMQIEGGGPGPSTPMPRWIDVTAQFPAASAAANARFYCLGGETYFSYSSTHYKIHEDGTWEKLTASTPFPTQGGRHIWTDGENVYYDYSSTSTANNHLIAVYEESKDVWYWQTNKWTLPSGVTTMNGECVWKDGNRIVYSYGSTQLVLDLATKTWSKITWGGTAPSSFYGYDLFVDVENNMVYYLNGSYKYYKNLGGDTWIRTTGQGTYSRDNTFCPAPGTFYCSTGSSIAIPYATSMSYSNDFTLTNQKSLVFAGVPFVQPANIYSMKGLTRPSPIATTLPLGNGVTVDWQTDDIYYAPPSTTAYSTPGHVYKLEIS